MDGNPSTRTWNNVRASNLGSYMMSRPMLLVFLFGVLVITSQFEWKQQLVSDDDVVQTMVSEFSEARVSNLKAADLVINGTLMETKLFIYGKKLDLLNYEAVS
ncbi:hypothetical protein Droror1_Dr00012403 [Drosera rotundifolia]